MKALAEIARLAIEGAIVVTPSAVGVAMGLLVMLALTTVYWIYRLNKGLREFDALFIVPVMQVSSQPVDLVQPRVPPRRRSDTAPQARHARARPRPRLARVIEGALPAFRSTAPPCSAPHITSSRGRLTCLALPLDQLDSHRHHRGRRVL